MAPKGQKRGAQEAKNAAGGKKSRANKDPTTAAIEDVINKAELPESCREMLLMGISPSLQTAAGERHEIQELVVTMIEELILASETSLRAAVVEAQRAEATCEATKTALASKLSDSDAVLAEKIRTVDEKAVTLAAVEEKMNSASAVLAEKQDLQRIGDAKMVETQGIKASVQKGIETDYVKILEGAADVSELLPVLKQLSCDDSLVQALSSTCAKAPGDRGAFDTMVLNQLETSLKQKLEELTKLVEAESPGAEERAAAVATADKQLEDAKAEQVTATEEHAAADAHRVDASSLVKAAKAELKAHEPQVRTTTKAHVQAVATLDAFQQDTRAPFDLLRSPPNMNEIAIVSESKVTEMETDSMAAVTVGGA